MIIKLWDGGDGAIVEKGESTLMDTLLFYASLTILREVISSFYRYHVTSTNWSRNLNVDFSVCFYHSDLFSCVGL